MRKRLLAMLLSLSMALTLLPAVAQAGLVESIFAVAPVLQVGDTYQLEIMRDPNGLAGTVTYNSWDKAIATVSETGLVTAVAEGEARIYCKINDSIGDIVMVTVGKPTATTIELEKTSVRLEVGKSTAVKVKATNVPDKALSKAMSADNGVASANGTANYLSIDAVAPGTTTVHYRLGAAYATCEVEVGYFAPTGVTLDCKTKEIPAGDSFQLKAYLVPATAEGTVTFVSANENVAKVDEKGMVKGLKAGSSIITATVKGTRFTTTCKVVVLPSSVTAATITPPTKTTYRKGQLLQLDGGKVTLTKTDGTSTSLPLNENMISGFDRNLVGTQTVTITYGKNHLDFDVTVTDKVIKSTTIQLPYKTTYNYGESLVVSDGRIKILYVGDTVDNVVMTTDMVSGYDPQREGRQTLTVTYGEETKTYIVTVGKAPAKPTGQPVEKPKEPATEKPVTPPPTNPFAGFDAEAVPSATKLVVDGKAVSVDAYLINENNYMKLRDLATLVTGSKKQFNVGWDGAQNAINLTPYTPYTPVGGEMAAGDGQKKGANVSTSAVLMGGSGLDMTAYLIGQNNYFKLRDVMEIFNVNVGWDQATGTVTLDTTKNYE